MVTFLLYHTKKEIQSKVFGEFLQFSADSILKNRKKISNSAISSGNFSSKLATTNILVNSLNLAYSVGFEAAELFLLNWRLQYIFFTQNTCEKPSSSKIKKTENQLYRTAPIGYQNWFGLSTFPVFCQTKSHVTRKKYYVLYFTCEPKYYRVTVSMRKSLFYIISFISHFSIPYIDIWDLLHRFSHLPKYNNQSHR